MNINDVTEAIKVPTTKKGIWAGIFARQMALALKYKEIEKMGDLLDTTDNNINTGKGQKWIKDFAWRVTEEMAEAYEAVDHLEHFKEELIDALHFLVELTIISGYTHEFILERVREIDMPLPWHVIYEMGLMCNTLKNKPWKQSQMLTDRNTFEHHLINTWSEFIRLLYYEVGTDEDIFKYYFKKNKVNQFRQRSKY